MIIAVPKEIQNNEYRVALIPEGARALAAMGHRVVVQKDCGRGSGFADEDYRRAGAELARDAASLFRKAEMILKVKQPDPAEVGLFHRGQILFSYVHAQTRPWLLNGLLAGGVTAIALEDVQLPDGSRPLLAPMSHIAGHMAVLIGCQFLERHRGGMGVMIGRTEGIPDPLVVILGGGVAGARAAQAAAGLQARIALYEVSARRRAELKKRLRSPLIEILPPDKRSLKQRLEEAALLINTTNWPAHTKDHLVTRAMVRGMPKGAVIVDVTADLCGAIETTFRHTSHSAPTFTEEGVLHYVVPNIPGSVPRTATLALTAATFPYVREIAEKGLRKALLENEALLKGLNCHKGMCTSRALAKLHGKRWHDAREAIRTE
jgi:alanine dehydrogenase